MLENSQDLFYVVLSFCILWLTVFLCVCFYYWIRILKSVDDSLRDIRERFTKAASFANFLRGKVVDEGMKGFAFLFNLLKEKAKTKKTGK